MSRPANPYDNAACESVMKTLKQEEIYCREYQDLQNLETHLEEFVNRYYNQRRLYSALGTEHLRSSKVNTEIRHQRRKRTPQG